MRALIWRGKRHVRAEDVPDPRIEQPTVAIGGISSTAICGSDVHLYEVPLERARHGYTIFEKKEDSCSTVVLHP